MKESRPPVQDPGMQDSDWWNDSPGKEVTRYFEDVDARQAVIDALRRLNPHRPSESAEYGPDPITRAAEQDVTPGSESSAPSSPLGIRRNTEVAAGATDWMIRQPLVARHDPAHDQVLQGLRGHFPGGGQQ